jgi:hypothetical protein
VKSIRQLISLPIIAATVLLGGCATNIKTNVSQNPPPTEKFSNFSKIEISKVSLVAPYAGQPANESALASIQSNLSLRMVPLIVNWNHSGRGSNGRTLVITPVVTQIKFIGTGARMWAGAYAGSSAVVLTAKITEKGTGRVIASPVFYSRANAFGGAWSAGATDRQMLERVANNLSNYIEANFNARVGGPSGAKPTKQ